MPIVSFREILRFYFPLVLNSQMMTLSGPIINLAVGRAADPKLELAAFAIGFTTLLFIESPCLAVQSVSATLAAGPRAVRALFLAAVGTAVVASGVVLVVALTPLGDFVFEQLIPTTPRVAELARTVLAWLSPVPLVIAIRGVGNGIAIRSRRTVLVARATFFRIASLATVVGIVVAAGSGSGAIAGVAAFLTGVTLEAAVIWYGVWPHRPRSRAGRVIGEAEPKRLHVEIARLWTPLAVSAFAWTLFRPVVNAILGRLPDPELAQAGFGVVMPLALLTSSPLWTLQNVSLVLTESRADLARVVRFAAGASVAFGGVVLALSLPPIRSVLLADVYALSPDLQAVVAPALVVLAIEPLVLGARSLAQGLLMRARRTGAFLVGAPLKIGLVAWIGYTLAGRTDPVHGVLLGTLLFVGGDLFEAILYGLVARRLVASGLLFGATLPPTEPPGEKDGAWRTLPRQRSSPSSFR